MLTIAPAIWALHFLLSYVTVAIWCAKYAGDDGLLGGARTAIAVHTVVALAGICVTGAIGLKRHKLGSASLPHDADVAEDRHRFMGFATLLLATLSAIATIFVAAVACFVETCD